MPCMAPLLEARRGEGIRTERIRHREVQAILGDRLKECSRDLSSLPVPGNQPKCSGIGALECREEQGIRDTVEKRGCEIGLGQVKTAELDLVAQSAGRGPNDLSRICKSDPALKRG